MPRQRSSVNALFASALCTFALQAPAQPQSEGSADRSAQQKRSGVNAQSQARSQEHRRLSSEQIAHAVEEELHGDPLVSFDQVDVTAGERGEVVLSGAAATLLAKERASRVAETVRGVRSVDNRIDVQPKPAASAEDLESTIRQALLTNPATESFQVQVNANAEGEVALTGKVNSWAELDLVGRVAKGVSGVTQVRNDVHVNYVPLRSDKELATEIDTMLRWDAYLDERGIDVRVRDAVVTLSGTVGSVAEKRRAINIARTAGTRDIDAQALEVDPSMLEQDRKKAVTEISDPLIAQAVRARLGTSPTMIPEEIEVSVDRGVVTLRGTVDSLQDRRIARSIAQGIVGVQSVRDRIRVRDTAEDRLTDEDIEKRVITALAVNPITEAYMIAVDVNNGVVDLAGHVDTWFERGTADDVAAAVRGVRAVDNDLRVENRAETMGFDPYVDTWSIYDYEWYEPGSYTEWRQDALIAQEVRDQLWWSPFVDEEEVTVSVEDGVVTLSGRVDNWSERSAATENALQAGATSVVNRIDVEG